MEHLLAFMYRGETTVPTQDLLPLIESAKMLGIQGLMDPGNIKQLLEQSAGYDPAGQIKLASGEPGPGQEEEQAWKDHSNAGETTIEDIIKQEVKDNCQTEAQQPDSSNNVFQNRTSPVSSQMTGMAHLIFLKPIWD